MTSPEETVPPRALTETVPPRRTDAVSAISDHSRDSGVVPPLSVVVPIYNVEDYLIACLESLTSQTLTGIEVILVDDGSTDDSGRMADEFAAGRPGWKVLHVENGGLGRARN